MEYFVLNEYSLPKNRDQESCLKCFFELYLTATKNNFKEIRVSDNIDAGWYQISISENRTIRNWISEQERDYERRLKSIISSTTTPVIDINAIETQERLSLSDFKLNENSVPILGATYLLNQLALSFNTNAIYDNQYIQLQHEELIDDELVKSDVTVNNVSTKAHWKIHYQQIEAERKAQNVADKDFSSFDNIIFTDAAVKQIGKENSKSFISELWEVINKLDVAIEGEAGISLELLKEKTGLSMSDESDNVKDNPKLNRHRKFQYNEKRQFFGFHIKNFTSARRMHFIIDNNKIVVGYAGKHLPL